MPFARGLAAAGNRVLACARHCRTVSATTSPDDVPRIDPALTDPPRWMHRMPVWILAGFVVCAVALYAIALTDGQGSGHGQSAGPAQASHAACAHQLDRVDELVAEGLAVSRRATYDHAAATFVAARTVHAVIRLRSLGCDKYGDLSGVRAGCRELAATFDLDTGAGC